MSSDLLFSLYFCPVNSISSAQENYSGIGSKSRLERQRNIGINVKMLQRTRLHKANASTTPTTRQHVLNPRSTDIYIHRGKYLLTSHGIICRVHVITW